MRKNYYGRRRWNSNRTNNKSNEQSKLIVTTRNNTSAFAKYKELLDKASKASDPIDQVNLLQLAEHWLKVSNDKED
tara:strand:- start:6917 stop:7144 length:228 start_codon:yes stop_codon:yes gene_type:complete